MFLHLSRLLDVFFGVLLLVGSNQFLRLVLEHLDLVVELLLLLLESLDLDIKIIESSLDLYFLLSNLLGFALGWRRRSCFFLIIVAPSEQLIKE